MTHVVIGLFDNYSDANHAVDSLKQNGFNSNEIDLSRRQSQKKSDEEKWHEEETGENSVTRFFRRLFGADNDEADKYSHLAYDIGTVVSVYCNSEVEANQAADLMDECGAANVEDRSSKKLNTGSLHEQPTDLPNATPGHSDPQHPDHKTPMVTMETTRTGERTAPGTGVEETGGSRSKSRVIQWQGEASARLREDRLNDTKFW
jgi:hypothetical protein